MQPAFLLAHSFNSPLIGTLLCLRLILDQARAICQPATESCKNQFVALLQFSAFFYKNKKIEKDAGGGFPFDYNVNGNFENTRLLFPTISLVNFIYSKVLITKKEYVKVVALYEKSIAMAKIFPNLICEVFENMHIAIAYDNLPKRKDAVEKLEKALEIALSDRLYMIFAENYTDIKNLLDEIYEKGNFKEAIDEIRRLQKPYDKFLKFVKKEKSRLAELSERELEVANLAAQGFTNNEIAKTLFVSVNTVKTILKAVFKKLCIKSRQEIKDVLKSQNNN